MAFIVRAFARRILSTNNWKGDARALRFDSLFFQEQKTAKLLAKKISK